MPSIDEEIARSIAEAQACGELSGARSWGKPLPADAGWDATPEALRMPFKMLKDAGFAPPEIELFHERARLRAQLEGSADADERRDLRQRLSELEQKLALRLESLRVNASL